MIRQYGKETAPVGYSHSRSDSLSKIVGGSIVITLISYEFIVLHKSFHKMKLSNYLQLTDFSILYRHNHQYLFRFLYFWTSFSKLIIFLIQLITPVI